MKPDGVGAGGCFAKGLFGGNSDFGSVAGFMEANGFDGFCSVGDDTANVLEGVAVAVFGAVIFAKGLFPEDVVDPKEKEGSCEVENVGALIEPNNPPEPEAGC